MPASPGKTRSRAHTNTRWSTLAGVYLALLQFRIINARNVQTFFQPDEYFQALEPAWRIAFGSESGAWITWEWREQLRTAIHPYLFAAAYRMTDWLCSIGLIRYPSRATALLAAPGILQAFFAAFLDLFTWQTAVKLYGPTSSESFAALALTIMSPWQWFCSTRTFSNSLETTLTAASIAFFPWEWYLTPGNVKKNLSSKGLFPALTAAAMAFYLRPTNVIIWMAISAALVYCNRSLAKAVTLVRSATIVGITILVAFVAIDRSYYGSWVFPPLRFLYFNLVQSLAIFYGTNRVDYYFTEGLPLLLTTILPFAGAGAWQSLRAVCDTSGEADVDRQTRFVLAFAAATTLISLTTIAHKEVRFIYPLLPLLHILAARPFASFFKPLPIPRSKIRQAMLVALVATSVYIANYVSTTHQRGVTDVMHYLRQEREAWVDLGSNDLPDTISNTNMTVGFLMPCHSTPWRSHLVYPEIQAWALTCEPPVNMSSDERTAYLDEADVFYADPAVWLLRVMCDEAHTRISMPNLVRPSEPRLWPHYLVFFEQLEPTLKDFLHGSDYKECRRFFNTHWHDDSRRKGDVIVWCKRQQHYLER